MNWIDNLIKDYFIFLKEKTVIKELNGTDWIEISTPFTDVFNDSIDIYAKRNNGEIILSDDGHTLKNLDLTGIDIFRSPKRKAILDTVLLNYGVALKENEFIIKANDKNFAQKKHNLISAIFETNDMYVLAKHTVASMFREDVKKFLDEQEDIIYTPYFISKGSTGLDFNFDFQIAYKNTEILIKAFNSINSFNLTNFIFTWDDVKQVREKQTEKKVSGLAFINNEKKDVKPEYLDALESKNTEYILWSQRYETSNRKKLKAA